MKRLILITGSSRGIGEAIALEFNSVYNRLGGHTHFILLARDINRLNEVKEKIVKSSNNLNQVTLIQIDFSVKHQVSHYFDLLKRSLSDVNESETYSELIAIYNHGSLEFGNVSLQAQEALRDKFEINLFSIWHLLAAATLLLPTNLIPIQFHVNISSGYAVEPAANWSGHCCARASRDMLFKCLALEQPSLRVLNYEPGIVHTDMLQQAVDSVPEYQGYEIDSCIKPEQTAKRLVGIILQNEFVSGSRHKY